MGVWENYALTAVMYGYATQTSNAWQMTTINMLPYCLVGLEVVCVAIHVAPPKVWAVHTAFL